MTHEVKNPGEVGVEIMEKLDAVHDDIAGIKKDVAALKAELVSAKPMQAPPPAIGVGTSDYGSKK